MGTEIHGDVFSVSLSGMLLTLEPISKTVVTPELICRESRQRLLDSPPERVAGWPPKTSGNDSVGWQGVFETASTHLPGMLSGAESHRGGTPVRHSVWRREPQRGWSLSLPVLCFCSYTESHGEILLCVTLFRLTNETRKTGRRTTLST